MQKILFNDKYGLTKAVLEGRKTQTRRIANATLIDVACVEKRKNDDGSFSYFLRNGQYGTSKYKIGEEIAVAQPYKEVCGYYEQEYEIGKDLEEELKGHKGYNNKMFVAAGLMPHRIRITGIRVERLQEISDEDCIAEGIKENPEVQRDMWGFSYIKGVALKFELSTTPRGAYAKLIDHISGKGTWASNPYVFVYEFELIK